MMPIGSAPKLLLDEEQAQHVLHQPVFSFKIGLSMIALMRVPHSLFYKYSTYNVLRVYLTFFNYRI